MTIIINLLLVRFFPDMSKKKNKPPKTLDAEQEEIVRDVKDLFRYQEKPLWSKIVAAKSSRSPMSKTSTYIDPSSPLCDMSVPPPPFISKDDQTNLPMSTIPAVSNKCDVTVLTPPLYNTNPGPNNIPLGTSVATTILLPSWSITTPVSYEPSRYIHCSYGYVPQNALNPPCIYMPPTQLSYQ